MAESGSEIASKKIADAAISIIIDQNIKGIDNLRNDGEPLTPIVMAYSQKVTAETQLSRVSDASRIVTCMSTLVAIAPDDASVNKYIISGLSSINETVIRTSVYLCKKISKGKNAVTQISKIALSSSTDNRSAAIATLVDLADDENYKTVEKTLNSMRFDQNASIRKLADESIEKVKDKMTKKKEK